MALVDQFMMERNAEILLARSVSSGHFSDLKEFFV
jgi:hypothetical protein